MLEKMVKGQQKGSLITEFFPRVHIMEWTSFCKIFFDIHKYIDAYAHTNVIKFGKGLNEKAENEVTKWTKRDGNNVGLPEVTASKIISNSRSPPSSHLTLA